LNRSQLELQIEAGDWAAVGATAALLAATSDSHSAASPSPTSRGLRRSASSKDEARAEELDQLVDAGDWDGLIAAAAKFESAASSAGTSSKSSDRGSRASSASSATSESDRSTGVGTTGTPSYETSVSDSVSKAQRRDEIRSEVEALVRRVVPEEIDNVEEMMNQFKGREEELVETLRTMQERSIANKARTAGQRAAKVEARQNAKRGIVPWLKQSSRPNSNTALENPQATVSADSKESGDSSSTSANESFEQNRSVLESAINSADWHAVGEAAALLSDASSKSQSSPSQEEMEALAQAELWTKIAERRKADGANDAGASDAAEWAIQRSLSKMNEDERRSSSEKQGDEEV